MKPIARIKRHALSTEERFLGTSVGVSGGKIRVSGSTVLGSLLVETISADFLTPTAAASCSANLTADGHSSINPRRNAAFPSSVNAAMGLY
jgi:hypothetical protein